MSSSRRFRWNEYALFGAIVVQAVIFALIAPGFLSLQNLINILLSIAVTGVLAVGMTVVMITGGIDLGVGSVVALSGVLAAMVIAPTHSAIVAPLLAALGVGAVIGVINGSLVAYLRVPSFIVTLAMLTAARGLAFLVSGGQSHGDLPDAFGVVGRSVVFGIPTPVIIMALVMAGGSFLLRRTVYGRHVYAVGGNTEAAWLAGIDTRRVTWLAYLFDGLLVGLGGLMLASRLGAGVPSAGVQYELDVIAACVVGGTSLNGGKGTIIGTLTGTAFIGILTNGLNLANVDPYVQKIALGVVIVLAVGGDKLGRRGETP
ncbi:MAG: ABC transporter permease [Gemmatimonadales bacterium]